jgi:DNA-binding NarL/FixJ family response regulator
VGPKLLPGQSSVTQPARSSFPGDPHGASTVSKRQLEVLRLLDKGQSNKLIAHNLGLSISTVKVHLGGLYRALGAQNRVEAVLLGRTSSASSIS